MIIQTAPKGQPSFVILQADHARMSGQLAAAFGNDRFLPLSPRELMEFVVAHHDEGWAPLDGQALQDRDTGLPYNLVRTPLSLLLQTSAASPDFNEAHDPYCGIISSMHSWGLYNGRYGLSDKIFVDNVPPEHQAQTRAMLDNELARQARLKKQVAASPENAGLVTDVVLMHNYKLLQFFDTLALYFHTTHRTSRGKTEFKNVPATLGRDVTITIEPAGGRYRLDPWPFAYESLSVGTHGRWMTPQPAGVDLVQIMQSIPVSSETVTLMPA